MLQHCVQICVWRRRASARLIASFNTETTMVTAFSFSAIFSKKANYHWNVAHEVPQFLIGETRWPLFIVLTTLYFFFCEIPQDSTRRNKAAVREFFLWVCNPTNWNMTRIYDARLAIRRCDSSRRRYETACRRRDNLIRVEDVKRGSTTDDREFAPHFKSVNWPYNINTVFVPFQTP